MGLKDPKRPSEAYRNQVADFSAVITEFLGNLRGV